MGLIEGLMPMDRPFKVLYKLTTYLLHVSNKLIEVSDVDSDCDEDD